MGFEDLLLMGFLAMQMKVMSFSLSVQVMGRTEPLWDSLEVFPRVFQL